jgi:hypothetical protein
MNRIRNAYGAKFRALLPRVGTRKPDQAMRWFFQQAEALASEKLSIAEALEVVYQRTRRRMAGFAGKQPERVRKHPVVFVCDVGLGGLARWLRAAGYMAWWRDGVEDAALIQEARQKLAILLTTDSGMMERKVLRDGELPALWVSPGLTKMQQLESVLAELELPLLSPRCMDCGGELERVEKEAMAERIPPKTYRWRDEYFQCRSCGKLFWYGTHWKRISQGLQRFSK